MLVSKPSNAHIVHIVMHPNVIEVGKYEVSNANLFGSYATCNLNGFFLFL